MPTNTVVIDALNVRQLLVSRALARPILAKRGLKVVPMATVCCPSLTPVSATAVFPWEITVVISDTKYLKIGGDC